MGYGYLLGFAALCQLTRHIRLIIRFLFVGDQFYDGIRRMKHEMKNHLTNIKGLLESGDYGGMGQYISRMDESMDAFEFSIKTGNAVTDVIVNDRQKAAEKQGIRFRSEFTYPESERYDAYDIGIIVNNLLQNALEACGKMRQGGRYIFISSMIHPNCPYVWRRK